MNPRFRKESGVLFFRIIVFVIVVVLVLEERWSHVGRWSFGRKCRINLGTSSPSISEGLYTESADLGIDVG
jgi:hypothetical protein